MTSQRRLSDKEQVRKEYCRASTCLGKSPQGIILGLRSVIVHPILSDGERNKIARIKINGVDAVAIGRGEIDGFDVDGSFYLKNRRLHYLDFVRGSKFGVALHLAQCRKIKGYSYEISTGG